ncbi:carabin isoform X2 [Oryctolagus cuniculus]|uniref:TBC1 domain family member 10C n=1 Tax=Oryctolagus cuniculus TaxID=9986 RepID=A0A5F9C7D7_RABIT|nr:carabin isoform X2 [Oryctolagus cuniculus]
MARALGEELLQTSELQEDSSSLGSDSELSGPGPYRQADRYGFIGGCSAEEPGTGQPPAGLIRQREMQWVELTQHWEKTMSRRYKKVKLQCRKGIPSALRARCWPLLCGAHVRQSGSPGTYQELAEAPGDPQWLETIGRDLHRQFPLHEMFVSPQGHGRGSCRCSRPTPCTGPTRATAKPRAPWPPCCSCTCPRRRPSGAWCRSVRSTSPATTGPTWCQGVVPRGTDAGAPGPGHRRAACRLPRAPGDPGRPEGHPRFAAAGGGLHVAGAQRGPVREGPAAGDPGPAGPAVGRSAGAIATATGPSSRSPGHL